MNTPDKCPHCGAEVPEYAPAGFYSCGSSVGIEFHQSDFCRERAANGKPTGEPNPNGSTNARLNWWKQRCDALSDELTREREKWEKFRTWVGCDSFANGSLIHSSEIAKKMNILDAEAKEGK